MAALLTNLGEKKLLDWVASVMEGTPVGKDVFLRLFEDDETPSATSVWGDFDEADFDGYAAVQLDAWDAAITDGAGAIIVAEEAVFAFDSGSPAGGSNTIYGAALVDEDGTLIAAERFAGAPITISANGDEIHYTAKIKLTEKTEACV